MSTIGIIGGGIIGLSTAWYLQEAGCQVTVLDQGNYTDGCSYGNAGMIVPSHIVPLAAPGVVRKGLRWLLDSRSPFGIRPELDKDLVRWLYRFCLSANRKNVVSAIPHLAKLSLWSRALFQDLSDDPRLDFALQESGILLLYQKDKTGREEAQTAAIANQLGIEANAFTKATLAAFDPTVQYGARGAVFYPGDAIVEPSKLMTGLRRAILNKGGKVLVSKHVDKIYKDGRQMVAISTGEESWTFDHYVICSGIWSASLLRQLAVWIPVVSGKGYSFMTANTIGIHQPSLLIDHKVSVTPVGNQLRIGGTMVLGDHSTKISANRIRGMITAIQQYYPALEIAMPALDDVWYGFRPCSPDGLPIIGRVPGVDNLVVATGHGMMGMSLGPATGKLVSQIILERSTHLDTTPFVPERFQC